MPDFDVMILGAGGVGCVVGGQLCAAGYKVQLVNRSPDTANAIAKNGLRLELNDGLKVTRPDAVTSSDAGSARFVMCFTKTHQTGDAVRSIAGVLTEETILVSMQNGLGNGQLLSEMTARDVLHGVTLLPATVLGPAHIRSIGSHKSWLGPLELQNARQRTACDQLAEMLNKSQLETETPENVLPSIWQKACFNVAMNGASALADASPGLIGDTPELKAEAHALADEALQLAAALDITLEADQVHEMIDFACREHRYHLPSMLQDIRANRQTEIASLNGYVVAEAARLGLAVPKCQLINGLIRARQAAPAFWEGQPK